MLIKKPLPDADTLRSKFEYRDGRLLSRVQTTRCKVGDPVGFVNANGYVIVKVGQTPYYAHRLIYQMEVGKIGGMEVDHINGIRHDNRIENLRLVSRQENNQNLHAAKRHNKIGLLGVSQKFGKFVAQIRRGGKYVSLGLFDTPEEAHGAYLVAKREAHAGCTI